MKERLSSQQKVNSTELLCLNDTNGRIHSYTRPFLTSLTSITHLTKLQTPRTQPHLQRPSTTADTAEYSTFF